VRDANVIILSSVDWDFNRQNPQEVALGLAAAGNGVLFIENTGVRGVRWRDVPRIWSRLRNWWRSRGGFRAGTAGAIDIHSPLLLTLPYSRTATSINRRMLLRVIRRWLRRGGRKGPLIVITFLPTPLALEVIAALRPALVVYYCIDQMAESSPAARRVASSESRLIADADLVFVTSRELFEMAKPLASRVELLVSGVRCEEFAAERERARQPHRLDAIPRPRIGFVGSLRGAIDLPLIAAMARVAPDLHFVLAGPNFTDTSLFAPLPNVHLLGPITHAEVIESMVRLDVGNLPYTLSPFTAAVMPVKLKEYLAAGLPIVATLLPELVAFAERHPGVIAFAGDAESFVRELRAALAANTAGAEEHRMTIAREYDWRRQIDSMIESMDAVSR
jgi:glycosyltransferase involved in cell wall biosynthesis